MNEDMELEMGLVSTKVRRLFIKYVELDVGRRKGSYVLERLKNQPSDLSYFNNQLVTINVYLWQMF